MGIYLQKGQKFDLSQGNTGLRRLLVGLGWDAEKQTRSSLEFNKSVMNISNVLKIGRKNIAAVGEFLGIGTKKSIDCDVAVFICGQDGKLLRNQEENIVFYGHLSDPSGAIVHQGDNLTGGAGSNDCEQIVVDLGRIAPEITKLIFTVNIYDGTSRQQDFSKVQNAYIRIMDMDTKEEICRFNLSENYEGMTGLVVGEIYRRGSAWKFNAIGQAVKEANRLNAFIPLFS